MQKYQTNWLSPLNTFVLKGNFISLSQVENEYHLLEVEGYHENKTMLLNFKQILFPPKGAGFKTCPIYAPRKLWEGSEFFLSFWAHLYGSTAGKVHKTCLHLLLFLCQRGSSDKPEGRSTPLVDPAAERPQGHSEHLLQLGASHITQSKSFRAGVQRKKLRPRVEQALPKVI